MRIYDIQTLDIWLKHFCYLHYKQIFDYCEIPDRQILYLEFFVLKIMHKSIHYKNIFLLDNELLKV